VLSFQVLRFVASSVVSPLRGSRSIVGLDRGLTPTVKTNYAAIAALEANANGCEPTANRQVLMANSQRLTAKS
jgi:hypothetical protein